MKKDLTIIAGYTFTQPFQVVGVDENGIQYDFDLTNAVVTAVAKPSVNSCKSYPFTVTITDAPTGKFVISMDADLTDTITETTLVYDVKVDNTSGFVFRAAYGSIAVEKEISP